MTMSVEFLRAKLAANEDDARRLLRGAGALPSPEVIAALRVLRRERREIASLLHIAGKREARSAER